VSTNRIDETAAYVVTILGSNSEAVCMLSMLCTTTESVNPAPRVPKVERALKNLPQGLAQFGLSGLDKIRSAPKILVQEFFAGGYTRQESSVRVPFAACAWYVQDLDVIREILCLRSVVRHLQSQ
jgi:hypothetical protein